jgi:stage III sporulation protein AC
MQTDVLLKIAGVGLLVTIIAQVLTRAGREDMAMLTTVAGLVMVLLTVVTLVGELLTRVTTIFNLN